MIVASFVLFLILFALVGVASGLSSKKTTQDYLTAEKSISPGLAGLSAVATNNSGFMFIGMIGMTFTQGLSSIWLMFGWVFGDLLASLLGLKSIKNQSDKISASSIGDLIARWQGADFSKVRHFSTSLIVIFLSGYAAAQFKAGGKALESLFEWDPAIGILGGAVLVLIYCFSGGIRASIWTDVAQSFVMIIGMFILVYQGYQLWHSDIQYEAVAQSLPARYFSIFHTDSWIEIILFIVGWFFGGIAVLGQPHIVTRFFAMTSSEGLKKMRYYYYGWFSFFYLATIAVGVLSRVLLSQDHPDLDPEMALPLLSKLILPDFGVGLILAAIFAATMSTADSLVLACTAAICGKGENSSQLKTAKWTTISVLTLSVLIAFSDNQSVFDLVLMSWGLLASVFLPPLILLVAKRSLSEIQMLGLMVIGIILFLSFKYSPVSVYIYEVAPSLIFTTIIGYVMSKKRTQ